MKCCAKCGDKDIDVLILRFPNECHSMDKIQLCHVCCATLLEQILTWNKDIAHIVSALIFYRPTIQISRQSIHKDSTLI